MSVEHRVTIGKRWILMADPWSMGKWALVSKNMSKTSAYDMVALLPETQEAISKIVRSAVLPDASRQSTVRKDLDAYLDFLVKHDQKLHRATDSLLSKPLVVAFLKGEEDEGVEYGTEDQLALKKIEVLQEQLRLLLLDVQTRRSVPGLVDGVKEGLEAALAEAMEEPPLRGGDVE